MTEETTRAPITGTEMFDYRRTALSLAIGARTPVDPVGMTMHTAGVFLHFLLEGMPIDSIPGGIVGPFPNTPDVLAQAGSVQPAAGATPISAAAAKKAAKLAADAAAKAAAGSASAESLLSPAPATAAVQQQAATVAAGSASTNSSPASSSPAVIAQPTTIAAAAESLKALVMNKTVGEAPQFGRAVAIAILKEFGVEQLNQVPPAKLAEIKARFDTANAAPAAQSNDPTGGLLG